LPQRAAFDLDNPATFLQCYAMKTHIRSILITVALLCHGLLPTAQAVVPPPDGGYPNFNTAEGQNALFNLTTGSANTAVGWFSLWGNAGGSFNTATGAGTLLFNTGDVNTAFGAAALLFNTSGNNNTAVGTAALLNNTIGEENTATGAFALSSNTEGDFNTANGAFALQVNTTGERNTATGDSAMFSNTTGTNNTATGNAALGFNTTGNENTAAGTAALFSNNANANTAVGSQALFSNSSGSGNTAVGHNALQGNTDGNFNTALGLNALLNNTTGTGNIALGAAAGDQLTTGDDNIDIGNNGQFSDTRTIRIGQDQTATYIAAIHGVNEGGSGILPVYINNLGRLGTQPPPSSRRFKEKIKPMDKTSEAILALKPVTFQYQSDKTNMPQFGLIAEQVADVNPELVLHDENGDIYTVRYEAVNAMLLNEFLKEHRTVQQQGAMIAELKKEIANLTGTVKEQATQLQRVSGQVEAIRFAPQLVASDR
jgi:Chaperone of endosialidase